jgi:hypothetical protein
MGGRASRQGVGDPGPGRTFYVSPTGNDGNSGTSPDDAWRTVDHVNQQFFQPGDTVLFQGGATFYGSIFLFYPVNGTNIAPVTFGSYGDGRATIRSDYYGFLATKAQGVSIQDLNFVGSWQPGNPGNGNVGIALLNNTSGTLAQLDIERVDVSGFGGYGVAIQGNPGALYQDVTIRNLNVSNNPSGISVTDAGGVTLQNLTVVGPWQPGNPVSANDGIFLANDSHALLDSITIDQVQASGFAEDGLILVGNSGSPYRNVSITHSDLHDNAAVGMVIYQNGGVAGTFLTGLYVGYVKCHDNPGVPGDGDSYQGNGFLLNSVDGGLVERSSFYNNGRLGGSYDNGGAGFQVIASTHIVVQYNEAYGNQSFYEDGDGIVFDSGVTNSILQYNYSHDNAGAGFFCYNHYPSPDQANVIRYNISENDAKLASNGKTGIMADHVSNDIFYNNTAFVDASRTRAFAAMSFFAQSVVVRNNIFVTSGNVSAVMANDGGHIFQGNAYYAPDLLPTNYAIVYGNSGYRTLGAFRDATGQEELNGSDVGYQGDPLLVRPGGGGLIGDPTRLEELLVAYRLLPGSPLQRTGLDLRQFGIDPGTHSFYGRAVPPFNIGAD